MDTYKVYEPELSKILTEDIGEGSVIHSHVCIYKKVKIGKRVKIQAFAFIPDGVTIEDDCFIGPRVTFTNDPKLTCKGPKYWKKTLVKKGAKIGAGVNILAGVTIGKNVIVGMGANVLRDVADNETVKGLVVVGDLG